MIWLGRAEQGELAAFDPSATALVSIRVRQAVSQDPGKQETALTLKSRSGSVWNVPFSPGKIQRLRFLALPAGQYDFALTTPGYAPVVRRGLDAKDGKLVSLPPIDIERIPAITGVVRDRHSGEPIPGAEIRSGDVMTSTGADGVFSLPPLTQSTTTREINILVSAANYASEEITIPPSRVGNPLPPILLTHGGTLRLIVQRECPDNCATTARLFIRRDTPIHTNRWRPVAQKSSSGKNVDYRFDALPEGAYAVVFEGESPLQRRVLYVTLDRDGKQEETVTLNDTLLKGFVTMGDQPLPNTTLTFSTDQSLWSGAVHTDGDGGYSVKLWQGGQWTLKINLPAEQRPFFSLRRLSDGVDQSWDVAIPTRVITGRVFDRKTLEAVADAEITDDVESNKSGVLLGVSDAYGRFRLPMVDAGTHTIRVHAQGFLDSEPVQVQLTEADTQRDVRFPLDRGIRIYCQVVDSAGEPMPNVAIYDWVGGLGLENRLPYWSDTWGRVTIPLRQGEQKVIYAIAQSGSFNVTLITSSTNSSADAPIKITLPPPVAALALLATYKSAPAAGVRLLVRYDGRFLPPRIWDMVTGTLSPAATTGNDGRLTVPALPAGTYEFWPYQTIADLRDLFTSVYTRQPARAVLSPGPNTVKVAVDAAH
jgi:hypothetical protein